MAQGLEIVVFALIAGYLFYRLWSVLGQNSTPDRPLKKVNSIIEAAEPDDNVIALTPRSSSLIDGADLLTEKAKAGFEVLLKQQPTFDINHFLNGAHAAFHMIVQAYAEGNRDMLKTLLSDKVYKQFVKVLDKSEKDGLKIENRVDSLKVLKIEDISIVKETINITLQFESEQMIATVNAAGEIHDNPARLSIAMINSWTFSRKLDATGPNWVLTATRTGA